MHVVQLVKHFIFIIPLITPRVKIWQPAILYQRIEKLLFPGNTLTPLS
jgi:hypothetical protein